MPKLDNTIADTQVKPNPALEKRTRRDLSPQYKLAMLIRIDQCQYGEIGATLRRAKRYHSKISDWRRSRDNGDLQSLGKAKPGSRARVSVEQRIHSQGEPVATP